MGSEYGFNIQGEPPSREEGLTVRRWVPLRRLIWRSFLGLTTGHLPPLPLPPPFFAFLPAEALFWRCWPAPPAAGSMAAARLLRFGGIRDGERRLTGPSSRLGLGHWVQCISQKSPQNKSGGRLITAPRARSPDSRGLTASATASPSSMGFSSFRGNASPFPIE